MKMELDFVLNQTNPKFFVKMKWAQTYIFSWLSFFLAKPYIYSWLNFFSIGKTYIFS
jgi:hypothetical protein